MPPQRAADPDSLVMQAMDRGLEVERAAAEISERRRQAAALQGARLRHAFAGHSGLSAPEGRSP